MDDCRNVVIYTVRCVIDYVNNNIQDNYTFWNFTCTWIIVVREKPWPLLEWKKQYRILKRRKTLLETVGKFPLNPELFVHTDRGGNLMLPAVILPNSFDLV